MFNLGLGEIVVIAAVALVFVRPEEIPAVARKLGMIWATARMNWDGMMRGFNENRKRDDE
ncbi:MAG: hypothetical protein COY40_02830 [Alphaproteobacteria bacterium CG_4_10_14_0_8_um_filter_53_9]|nr:MAG: hypothetical protein COY40_02830 [Alphaproteobacteria bacterium CG_4_10_14_0_8_um_filter_53_9]